MSASQLVDDSTLPGAGSNNNGAVTVTIQGSVGSATANAGNSPTAFGPALTAAVAQNGSYANLESKVTATTGNGGADMIGSTATILAGRASTPATVSMAWRTGVNPPNPGPSEGFVSDVLDLLGMAVVNGQTKDGSVHTDPFVLQMSYDSTVVEARTGMDELSAALADRITMDYLDAGPDGVIGTGDDQWELAAAGNFGSSNQHFAGVGPWNGDMTLGDYGVDVQSHTVWAVLDRDGDFAVVPEPGTLPLLGVAAVGLLSGVRRRHGPT